MLVVTHLSQEFKFQLAQDLSHAKEKINKVIFNPSFIFTYQSRLPVFLHLAVSGSDHVDVVANQLEREASVHESKATLQRDRQRHQTQHPLKRQCNRLFNADGKRNQ